ncbi:MAG: acyl-[acyl-carrier-protein] thioesterase [Acidimicrobiia bacterium]
MTSTMFVPEPVAGRVFRMTRAVRIGDTTTSGRLRLDALARYLQDVGNDDTRELGLGDGGAWVCRRIAIDVVTRLPQLREQVELATFCGGVGSRFAERRTTLRTADGAHVETATLWVYLDAETMRPAPVPDWFMEHYGTACGMHKPDHRLHLPGRTADASARLWPLRVTDFDVLGHVNNAIAAAALEDAWVDTKEPGVPAAVVIEYLGPMHLGDPVALWTAAGEPFAVWLGVGDEIRAAAQVTRRSTH